MRKALGVAGLLALLVFGLLLSSRGSVRAGENDEEDGTATPTATRVIVVYFCHKNTDGTFRLVQTILGSPEFLAEMTRPGNIPNVTPSTDCSKFNPPITPSPTQPSPPPTQAPTRSPTLAPTRPATATPTPSPTPSPAPTSTPQAALPKTSEVMVQAVIHNLRGVAGADLYLVTDFDGRASESLSTTSALRAAYGGSQVQVENDIRAGHRGNARQYAELIHGVGDSCTTQEVLLASPSFGLVLTARVNPADAPGMVRLVVDDQNRQSVNYTGC